MDNHSEILIPLPLSRLVSCGRIVACDNGIRFRTKEAWTFVTWAEAASASQIAELRTYVKNHCKDQKPGHIECSA